MKEHWENVYKTKQDNEVSWYQESPVTSINLVKKYLNNKEEAIIDIGGGNSNITPKLFEEGFTNLGVLDISEESLLRTKNKMGEDANKIDWFVSDILEFNPKKEYSIWHDRAVFHFLTTSLDKKKYVDRINEGLRKGGTFILATFSKEGPKKCSGLDISQYNKVELVSIFGEKFELLDSFNEVHTTPFETNQDFIYTIWKKK